MLTLDEMAEIHRLSFGVPRPWSKAELSDMARASGAIDLRRDTGFLLGRVIADEAELLTVAVYPDARRKGVGRALVNDFIGACEGVASVFLEVAADNAAAIALYESLGFDRVGLRKRYYGDVDAVVMARKNEACRWVTR